MSRNQQQGKYAGYMRGKHYRTHSASVHVSTLDCVLEVEWKRIQEAQAMFDSLFGRGFSKLFKGML